MDALTHMLTAIPWYGWVAIIAIVAGAVVKIMTSRDRPAPPRS